jgi:hypothetical protein
MVMENDNEEYVKISRPHERETINEDDMDNDGMGRLSINEDVNLIKMCRKENKHEKLSRSCGAYYNKHLLLFFSFHFYYINQFS